MSLKNVNANDVAHCPCCGAELDGIYTDYTIASRIGDRSTATDECHECYKEISFTNLGEGKVQVGWED